MEPANVAVTKTIIKSESKEDRVGDIKTIYHVSGWSIFWRNFLAGFSRALGGIFIYLVFVAISFYIFMTIAYPRLAPILNSYMTMMQSLSNGGKTPPTKAGPAPVEVPLNDIKNDPLFQQLIQKYQK